MNRKLKKAGMAAGLFFIAALRRDASLGSRPRGARALNLTLRSKSPCEPLLPYLPLSFLPAC